MLKYHQKYGERNNIDTEYLNLKQGKTFTNPILVNWVHAQQSDILTLAFQGKLYHLIAAIQNQLPLSFHLCHSIIDELQTYDLMALVYTFSKHESFFCNCTLIIEIDGTTDDFNTSLFKISKVLLTEEIFFNNAKLIIHNHLLFNSSIKTITDFEPIIRYCHNLHLTLGLLPNVKFSLSIDMM